MTPRRSPPPATPIPSRRSASKGGKASGTEAVAQFIAQLDHPLKPALQMVRSTIMGVSPEIAEGIKWNAPSFRTTEYFATANIDARHQPGDCVLIIFHLGAKVKDNSTSGLAIRDPDGLLNWLARDRQVP